MSKKRFFVFLMLLGAFCICFLVLTFGILGQDKPPEVFNISVIVRGKNSESWDSIKQGCDQAANDLNAELSFITLSEENSASEQIHLIDREIDGGADAIVLAAADSDDLAQAVDQASLKIPVICIESPVNSKKVSTYISADNYAMGVQLGKEIIESGNARKRLVVVESSWGCKNVQERMDGLISVLGSIGGNILHWQLPDDSEQASEMYLKKLAINEADVLVTLDVASLELAAQAISSSKKSIGLFGIGSTGKVASFIEQGVISATIVQNDFAVGYLGVQTAVNAIGMRLVEPNYTVEHRLINRANMYDTENQRLLFPFIR